MLLSTLFIFSKVVRFGTIYIICHIITGLIFCISYSRFPDLPRWSWILSSCNALKKRDELVSLIDKLEQEKASIDQKIQMELQDAGYGTAGDYRVSWLNTVSKRLDTKLFKAENPEMYDFLNANREMHSEIMRSAWHASAFSRAWSSTNSEFLMKFAILW